MQEPVLPLDVDIRDNDELLPAGHVTAVLGNQVIIQVMYQLQEIYPADLPVASEAGPTLVLLNIALILEQALKQKHS